GDRRSDLGGELLLGELGREVRLKQGDFLLLLLRQLRASSSAKLLHRIAPLLDQRGDHLKDALVVERLSSRLDLLVFDGALEHSQNAGGQLIFRAHRVLELCVHAFLQRSHASAPTCLVNLTQLLHRALLGGEGLLLPLHRRLLVVLALADLREDSRLLSRLLEALERTLDGFAFLDANAGHATTSLPPT